MHAVANGSEAKIADSMLRVLHHQGVLKDAGHDLRFNMRPGGNPGRGEFGGVVEAFLRRGGAEISTGQPLRRGGRASSGPARKTDLDDAARRGSRVEASWRALGRRALAWRR